MILSNDTAWSKLALFRYYCNILAILQCQPTKRFWLPLIGCVRAQFMPQLRAMFVRRSVLCGSIRSDDHLMRVWVGISKCESRFLWCIAHRAIHRCGIHCSTMEQTVEGYVCMLTGLVIGDITVYHASNKTDYWGRRVVGTHTIHKSGASKQKLAGEKIRRWTRSAINALFCSTERWAVYNHRMSKVKALCQTAQRNNRLFTDVNFILLTHVRKIPVSFNSPCTPNDKMLSILSDSIAQYAIMFPGLKHSQKTIFAFVSACVEKLRRGLIIYGTEIFSQSRFCENSRP